MSAPHVLLVGVAVELANELRRLAAVAGLEVRSAGSALDLPRQWGAATAVVVQADVVQTAAGLLPRRRAVALLVPTNAAAGGTASPQPWQAAVALGAETVLALPGQERALLDWLATAAEPVGPQATVVGVVGTRGGAGTSLLAAALALAAAGAGVPPVLVDADPHGGGIDLLLGAEQMPGTRWDALAGADGVVAARALHESLPRAADIALLAQSRPAVAPTPAAFAAVVAAARRAAALVVLDLPSRGAGVDLCAACDRLVVLTTDEVRAVAAAPALLQALPPDLDHRVVLRRAAPHPLPRAVVERMLARPLAATIGTDRALAAAVERGQLASVLPRRALGAAARSLVDDLLAVRQERAA